jgi:foldase protein PrsA
LARITLKFLLPLALTGAAVGFVACGNDVPPGAVAKVGDTEITQEQFDKWLAIATKGQAQGGQATELDAPEFTKCVAAKKKAPAPSGQAKQTDAALKKQCKTEYETIKSQVMRFLIQAEWVTQEAEKRDVEVKPAELKKTLEDQKKQAFPTDKAYKTYLKTSGMTEDDILFRVKLNELQTKLTQDVTEDAKKVSDADVEEYYEKNQKRFAQPERRDLLIVLTKTEAKADAAKQALDSGQSWKQVVKEYSIDETTKAQGGKLAAVAKGQQDKALEDAVFAASKGEVEGPVKTQFGWYVFEVEKITPASQQSLEQSRDTIKNLLRSQRQQKTLDAFIKDFREEYKDETNCSDDYRVAECKNAPKEDTDTGASQSNQPQPNQPQPNQPQPETQTPQPEK